MNFKLVAILVTPIGLTKVASEICCINFSVDDEPGPGSVEGVGRALGDPRTHDRLLKSKLQLRRKFEKSFFLFRVHFVSKNSLYTNLSVMVVKVGCES